MKQADTTSRPIEANAMPSKHEASRVGAEHARKTCDGPPAMQM